MSDENFLVKASTDDMWDDNVDIFSYSQGGFQGERLVKVMAGLKDNSMDRLSTIYLKRTMTFA